MNSMQLLLIVLFSTLIAYKNLFFPLKKIAKNISRLSSRLVYPDFIDNQYI